MARENPVLVTSFPAAGDLSAGQFHLVELSTGNVQLCNATTDVCVGVLQNDPAAAGEAADVCHSGISRVVAGAAITAGAKVAPTAAGRAQTAASGQHVVGIALEAAAANGDIITVLVCPGGAPLP